MRKMYIVLSLKDDYTLKRIGKEIFNYVWDYDSRHYKKERAIAQAKKWAKNVNNKFSTDYEWTDLFGIDEEYFDSQGYRC